MKTCKIDGCNKKATRRKMCDLHYRRVMKWGDPHYVKYKQVRGTLKDKVIAGISRDEKTGCWNWVRGKCSDGYGSIRHYGENWGAHRAAYFAMIGEIPTGMNVCHKCDNRACCNPDHLFLGTQLENVRDMHKKGRAVVPKGDDHACSTVSSQQVIEIYQLQFSGIKTVDLAKKYNISATHVRRIQTKKVWCHLWE